MNIPRLIKSSIGTTLLAGALVLTIPPSANAGVFVSVGIAPPAIPVYAQPPIPGDGYIWTPGYWAWTGEGYEWVDGAWVEPPYVDALWTPGYWGYGDGGYLWNAGYWGTSIGYYGGINYGFGYFGTGFYGGYWGGGHFCYNRGYNNFGGRGGFRNVYDRPVRGFNGRPGGSSFTTQNHGGRNFAGNRGAAIGGRNFGNPGFANNSQRGFTGSHSFAANGQHGFTNGNRSAYNGFANNRQSFNGARSFNGGNYATHSFAQSPRSYARPSQQGFGGQNHSFSNAPAARSSFGGGNGGFHGNMGGGGFHGGGGGGGFHGGGGGGGFHGGGGGGGSHGGGGGRR